MPSLKTSLTVAGTGLLLVVTLVHFVVAANNSKKSGVVDFPIFLESAQTFLETGELYPVDNIEEHYRPAAWVYKFPPLYAMLLLPVVAGGIEPGIIGQHWLLQIALFAISLLLLWRLGLGHRQTELRLALVVLLVGLNFEPFFETLWRLQLETPILLLLLLGLALSRSGRDGPAGVAFGLAVMLKIYPAFFLLPLLVRRRWRLLGWTAGTGVVVGLIGLAVIGWEQNRVYLLEVLPRMLAEPPSLDRENLAPAGYFRSWFGVSPMLAKRMMQLLGLPMLAVTLWLLHRRKPSREQGFLEFAAFVPLALLIMPNSWVNYQLLLLIPLVALAAYRPRPRGWILAATGIAFGLCLFYSPCDLTVESRSWPCAATPYFLGLFQLPRGVHDFFVDARVLSSIALWLAMLAALRDER